MDDQLVQHLTLRIVLPEGAKLATFKIFLWGAKIFVNIFGKRVFKNLNLAKKLYFV